MIDEGDSRLHYGMNKDVLDHRTKHDRVADDLVRVGNRTVAIRCVVWPDAKLRDNLQEMLLWGPLEAIQKALEIRAGALMARARDYAEPRGTGVGGGYEPAKLMIRYDEWYDRCKIKHFAPLMVREMIVEGLSLRTLDARHHFMTGTARKNLINCLREW